MPAGTDVDVVERVSHAWGFLGFFGWENSVSGREVDLCDLERWA